MPRACAEHFGGGHVGLHPYRVRVFSGGHNLGHVSGLVAGQAGCPHHSVRRFAGLRRATDDRTGGNGRALTGRSAVVGETDGRDGAAAKNAFFIVELLVTRMMLDRRITGRRPIVRTTAHPGRNPAYFPASSNGRRSNRPRLAFIGAQRSPTSAKRSRTLSIRKSASSMPASTSSHVTGVDTVARGLARTE